MVNRSKSEEVIYYAALEQPLDRRASYVKATCGDDLELLERVESLLRIREAGDNFLESPPFIDQPLTNTLPEEKPGTIIDRYKLLERIGEGGMAVVYMAEQAEPIRRKVALKIIKLGMDTKSVIARFEAERQALAMMDHPNIAKVLDAGATETGRPYFVMELVTGVSITEYCDKNNLNTKERLALFIQVCNAVQHAHQKGIIHRDIKPTNVMVTRHEGQPIPKVIDFGIAKAINQKLTEKTLFTRYAHIIGTPAYMSPEQADLSDFDVDTRSDIYSLGVLLYELLTGTTPFSEEELRKAGYLEMQRLIREQEPPKPSTKLSTLGETLTDIAKYRGSTPNLLAKIIRGDLDWIVMKALEKTRERRYDTVSVFAMDVQRYLNDEPVFARAPSTVYRLRKLLRRHRLRAVATLVISGLVVALIIVLLVWSHNQRQLNMEVSLQHRNALYRANLSFGLQDSATAMRELKPLLNSKYVGPDAHVLHDRILAEVQDKLRHCNSRIEADPQDPKCYFRRAQQFDYLGERDKANADMRRWSTILSQDWSSDLEFGTSENLGPVINASLSNIEPIPESLSLWYICRSGLGGAQEYWRTSRTTQDAPWETPVNFGAWDDSDWNLVKIVSCVTTSDGLEAYFHGTADQPGGHGGYDLRMKRRERIDDDWGPTENLGPTVNSAYAESHPAVSPDGLDLYFSEWGDDTRPGGQGKTDLWVTRRNTRDEPWGEPVNLGPTVNTKSNDQRPILVGDGLLLFFESNRPGGFGGLDLYLMRRAIITDPWTEPMNLGPKVNSPASDEHGFMSPDGSTLYFHSNRPGGYGIYDIWQVPVISLGSYSGRSEQMKSIMEKIESNPVKKTSPPNSK